MIHVCIILKQGSDIILLVNILPIILKWWVYFEHDHKVIIIHRLAIIFNIMKYLGMICFLLT